MVLLKSCTQYASKTQQWPQDWKRSISKKGNAKECYNYCTFVHISHAIKLMLKILQARHQQYMSQELTDVQSGFRKATEIRDYIANICWTKEKQGNSRKTFTSVSLTILKALTG